MSSAEGGPAAPSAEISDREGAVNRVLDAVSAELGDAVVASELHREDLWVRVTADSWRRTAEVCRSLGFEYFCFLSGIDWMPHTWPNPAQQGEGVASEAGAEGSEAEPSEAEPSAEGAAEGEPAGGPEADGEATPEARQGWDTGYAGGDTRFQVLARLHSISRKVGVILKADLDDERPRVESWTAVYPGADWHERETWEMYGFEFVGHPNLTHLYLPGEFEGFPLRKDYPLLAREVKPWPGLVDPEPMPEEAAGNGAAGEGEAEEQE